MVGKSIKFRKLFAMSRREQVYMYISSRAILNVVIKRETV